MKGRQGSEMKVLENEGLCRQGEGKNALEGGGEKMLEAAKEDERACRLQLYISRAGTFCTSCPTVPCPANLS